jgi:cold shock CspA family protein
MTQNQVSATPINSTSYVGQVKWFNNRLGYGFITIISECERRNEDIFVHQQHITPQTSDYRSLQQGEYVSFLLGKADTEGESSKHCTQAVSVTGVFGGTLMCDQIPRRNNAPSTTTESTKTQPQTTRPTGRGNGRFPRGRGGAVGTTAPRRQQSQPQQE